MVELAEGSVLQSKNEHVLNAFRYILKKYWCEPLLMLALGNPSRGDDAIPHTILSSLAENIAQLDDAMKPPWLLLEQIQLVQENIFDLETASGCIIIDVSLVHEQLSFEQIKSTQEYPLTSHSLAPEALLYWYREYFQQSFDACYLLAIPAKNFELGAQISPKGDKMLVEIVSTFKDVLKTVP